MTPMKKKNSLYILLLLLLSVFCCKPLQTIKTSHHSKRNKNQRKWIHISLLFATMTFMRDINPVHERCAGLFEGCYCFLMFAMLVSHRRETSFHTLHTKRPADFESESTRKKQSSRLLTCLGLAIIFPNYIHLLVCIMYLFGIDLWIWNRDTT